MIKEYKPGFMFFVDTLKLAVFFSSVTTAVLKTRLPFLSFIDSKYTLSDLSAKDIDAVLIPLLNKKFFIVDSLSK